MGADIHMFIEYRRPKGEYWSSHGGKINPGRHYGIFAKLADVRNYPSWGIVPICDPRGLPDNISYKAFDGLTLRVVDEGDDELDEDECTRKDADKWVEKGYSEYYREKRFVSIPDWHSKSWLTTQEFEEALSDTKIQYTKEEEPGYHAVLGSMKAYEEAGFEARIVFWFDN